MRFAFRDDAGLRRLWPEEDEQIAIGAFRTDVPSQRSRPAADVVQGSVPLSVGAANVVAAVAGDDVGSRRGRCDVHGGKGGIGARWKSNVALV